MSLNFLCNKCRDRLNTNPQEIPELCFNTYEAAMYYFEHNDFEEALPRIGSAFEMCEIMARTENIPFSYTSDALITTSKLLINTLTAMGKKNEPIEIYKRAKNCLIRANTLTPKIIKRQLNVLAQSAYGVDRNHLKLVHSRPDVVFH